MWMTPLRIGCPNHVCNFWTILPQLDNQLLDGGMFSFKHLDCRNRHHHINTVVATEILKYLSAPLSFTLWNIFRAQPLKSLRTQELTDQHFKSFWILKKTSEWYYGTRPLLLLVQNNNLERDGALWMNKTGTNSFIYYSIITISLCLHKICDPSWVNQKKTGLSLEIRLQSYFYSPSISYQFSERVWRYAYRNSNAPEKKK